MIYIKLQLLEWICELELNDMEIFRRTERVLESLPFVKIIDKKNVGDFNFKSITEEPSITIKIKEEKFCFTDIQVTDVYPILYGVFSYCAVCQKLLLIHSSVVYKDQSTVMILGDFGSGKTFLCECFREKKWRIISADQTLIGNIGGKWFVLGGSIYLKTDTKEERLCFSGYPVRLDNIIVLRGLANNGDVDIKKVKNYNGTIKKIIYALMWPYVTPLSNGSIFNFKYSEFCKQITEQLFKMHVLPVYHVRGDAKECVMKMEKIIESYQLEKRI